MEPAWEQELARATQAVNNLSARAPRQGPSAAAQFDVLYERFRREMVEVLRASKSDAAPLTGRRRRRAVGQARARITELEQHLASVEGSAETASRDAVSWWARAEAEVRAGRDEDVIDAIFQAGAHERMARILSCEAAEGKAACLELKAILEEVGGGRR